MNQIQKTEWEEIMLSIKFDRSTPLERIIGFKAAEGTYDLLSLREQLILDLLIAGWRHSDIGGLFDITAESITVALRRIRVKLAHSTLKVILDARIAFREGKL